MELGDYIVQLACIFTVIMIPVVYIYTGGNAAPKTSQYEFWKYLDDSAPPAATSFMSNVMSYFHCTGDALIIRNCLLGAIGGYVAYHALVSLVQFIVSASGQRAGAPSLVSQPPPIPSLEHGPFPPPFPAYSSKDFDFTKFNTSHTPGDWYQSSWYGSGSRIRPVPPTVSTVPGFQDAVSPLAESIVDLHNWTMSSVWFILGLVFFLFGAGLNRFWLRAWFPFTESDIAFRGTYLVTRKFSHSTWLESGWTAVPPLVILTMLIPTFGFLFSSEIPGIPEVTVKAIGHQWYWSYESADDDGRLPVDSYGLSSQELARGQVRLLEVDHRLRLPAPGLSQVLVTSQDVVHSWALPAAGAKVDAIPGRLNQLLFSLEVPGVYFGQCSELCGVSHSQMPIGVLADSSAWDLPYPLNPRSPGYEWIPATVRNPNSAISQAIQAGVVRDPWARR